MNNIRKYIITLSLGDTYAMQSADVDIACIIMEAILTKMRCDYGLYRWFTGRCIAAWTGVRTSNGRAGNQ